MLQMSRTKSFVRGFASVTAQKILIKLIGLIVTPIVLTYLDKSEYGFWVIIGSFLGYMGLMDFGVTGATATIAAKSNTKEDEHRINIVINNAFVLQSIIGGVIIIVGFIISFYLPDLFKIGDYSKEDAWLVLVMAIIGYGISFPPKSLKGLIRARQMIALSVWLEFILFILTTSLNLYLLHSGFGLLALPIGTIAVRLLSYPLFIVMAKKAYPQLRFDRSVITYDHMKEIFGVSSLWFVSMIAAIIIYSTDAILIGIFLSTAMVTLYALTFRLSEVIREWIYSINFTLMPGIGQIMGNGDLAKARDIYLRSQPVILSLAVIGAVFIYLFNGYFVQFWVGNEYYAGDTLSLIFAAIIFISVVFHSSSLVISADLKLKGVTTARIIEASTNIILSVWLVKTYGLIGVAFATLVSGLLTSFWVVPYMTMRHLKISVSIWFNNIVSKVLGVFIVCIALIFVAKQFQGYGASGFFYSLVVYCMGGLFALWFIAIDQQTRGMIRAKIRQ